MSELKPFWKGLDPHTKTIGNRKFNVSDCINMAKDLPVIDMDLNTMYVGYPLMWEHHTLRDIARQIKQCLDADLSYPIILNEDGVLIDGSHRIVKALLQGQKTIKAVKFDVDPTSCYEVI